MAAFENAQSRECCDEGGSIDYMACQAELISVSMENPL